jgi:hypothetical protein
MLVWQVVAELQIAGVICKKSVIAVTYSFFA